MTGFVEVSQNEMMVVDEGGWKAAVIVGATIIVVGAAFVAAVYCPAGINKASLCTTALIATACVTVIAQSI